MAPSRTLFIGRDGHKDALAVASVAQDHGAAGMSLGAIGTRQGDLAPLLRQMPSKAHPLSFVYAAGPCGDGLYRQRTPNGDDGWGVAPSRLPQKAGDRVNTDRKDAGPWARLARAGERTARSVPTGDEAAMRARTRARDATRRDLQEATVRRNAGVLRHEIRSTGRATWTPAPRRGLAAVVGPPPAQHLVSHAYVRAVTEPPARRQRLEPARQERGNAWRWRPGVDALQAVRGVPCTVAVTLVADRGALPRVDHPRARMNCVGLMPSENSPAARRRPGALTTAGHTHARRALGEGAWASRDPANVSRPRPRRRDHPPKAIQAIRWKAQGRLGPRSRNLRARGQHANPVVVAMARALLGVRWAMAPAGPVAPSAAWFDEHWRSTSKVSQRAPEEPPPRLWGHPRRREEPPRASSGLECGRHPTEARQGG